MSNKSKKTFAKLLLSLSAIILIAEFQISSADELVFYGNADKAPKIFNEKNLAKGILIDIMEIIKPEIGNSFRIELYPWKRSCLYAERGKGGIIGLSKTGKRLEIFDYSVPMYYDENVLVTLKDRKFEFREMNDLRDRKIGFLRGASYGIEFEHAKKNIIIPSEYNTPPEILRKLLSGHIDAAIIGGPGDMGLRHIINKNNDLKNNDFLFHVLEKPITRNSNHIAFAKTMNMTDLIKKIDVALQNAEKSGKIDAIIDKYIRNSKRRKKNQSGL